MAKLCHQSNVCFHCGMDLGESGKVEFLLNHTLCLNQAIKFTELKNIWVCKLCI